MIDSHTHIAACDEEPSALVARARAAGVERILTVGTDPSSCAASLALAAGLGEVYVAIGCHPNNAELLDEAQLRRDAAHPRCRAIGETGLDYYRDRSPRAAQRRAFELQIELANELRKPLVIHTREAALDTIELLEARAQAPVVLHCFSMHEQLERCVAAGWWLSFAGNVTYPANAALAAAAERVPRERLLVETDAPYLAPVPHRGKPNEPAFVVATARFLAERLGLAYAELEAICAANAAALFGW